MSNYPKPLPDDPKPTDIIARVLDYAVRGIIEWEVDDTEPAELARVNRVHRLLQAVVEWDRLRRIVISPACDFHSAKEFTAYSEVVAEMLRSL